MRTKLFLSYSRGDAQWRELFVKHLKTSLLLGQELWVDRDSIEPGDRWRQQITAAADESKCALLLVTPNYLEKGRFTRDELSLLAAQQSNGLTLLPVLVEPCAWQDEPILTELQFVRWSNSITQVRTADGLRETLQAIRDCGGPADVERAVIEACDQVRRELGVLAQTTSSQRDELLEMTRASLSKSNVQVDDPVHTGDSCVVYRGKWQQEDVAVKALPEAARRNRARTWFDTTVSKLEQLRDPAFVRVHFHVADREPHCVIMEFIEWPTLEKRLGAFPHRQLPPPLTARVLSTLARAQCEAQRSGVRLGPIAPENVHVSDNWDVRLSAARVDGPLALDTDVGRGQFLNWDILATSPPELCDEVAPAPEEASDSDEQYYLGMLGLELLLGRKPFEIRRFSDFRLKEQFFENPRAFFGYEAAAGRWTATHPAMALVLARLLARDPTGRFESTEAASKELAAVEQGFLPACARRVLEKDVEVVGCPDFAERFYARLFKRRPELEPRFSEAHLQPARLAEALQDLIAFRTDATRSRFLGVAKRHASYHLADEDYDAFREAFVEEIAATAPSGPESVDAWRAALIIGIATMQAEAAKRRIAPSASPDSGESAAAPTAPSPTVVAAPEGAAAASAASTRDVQQAN